MKRLRSLPLIDTKFFRSGALTRLPGPAFGKKYAEELSRNWQKLLLLGMFALGLFLGAKTAGSASEGWQERILELLRTQRLNRMDTGILANAIGYFGTDLLLLGLAFLLGICAGGLPLLLFLPLLRGLGIGVVSGWLYLNYGAAGIGYSVLVLYPAAIVSVLVMLAACKESILMSSDMLLMLGGKLDRAESNLRLYSTRYAVLLLVSVIAAALDALCFSAFSGVFTL